MKNIRRKKSFKVFVSILAAVCAVSLVCTFGFPFLSSGANLLTNGLFQVSAAVSDNLSRPEYDELLQENQRLTQENSRLRSQLADYYDVKEENERLWRFYGIKTQNPDCTYVPATVIRRDANDDFYSFTIDAGTAMGIKVNDPVITENGLIGIVARCDLTSARIKTLLSPEIKVGCEDIKTGDMGIVTGNATCCDDNLTTFTKIPSENTMQQGDVIATSGVGGMFPANLIVGEIKEISFDEYDATKYAVIEPYEDIRRVTGVLVITDFTTRGQVVIEDKADETADKAADETEE